MVNINNKRGFTIIEVVLVLAVAGLIFLVVFAAIPRLQASRRDNARKDAARAILALAIEYESNSGQFPTLGGMASAMPATGSPAGVMGPYYEDDDWTDPSGDRIEYNYIFTSTADTPRPGQFYFANTRVCNAAGNSVVVSPANGYVVLMELERGRYCVDNGVAPS